MKQLALAIVIVLAAHSTAFATWSVIALDAKTGQVIISSATCVRQASFPQRQPNPARDLMDVQAVIIPGVGIAACQAGVDNTRENQMLVYNELRKGTPPAQILEMLKKDPNVERRQFGIVAMPNGGTITERNNRAGFNGSGNSQSSLFFGGQVGDIHYQVQGNTLLGLQVVHGAALAFTRASGTMADRVMAAMEAADVNGGDHRCNCGNNPLDFVPCDDKTAHVAYIAIANKDDQLGTTHNDGKYYTYISVTDANTVKGESGNPVRTLRTRYDAWKKGGSARTAAPDASPFKLGSTPAATTRTQSLDHILPPRDSMGGTPTRFEWTAIDGADRYSLGIWGEADNMVFRQDNIPTASLAWPPDFKPEMGTYWWQVTALRGDQPLMESGRSAFVINR
ncbi:MAG TPA: DUF1028 domain-containing protein [Vicinamibacterales bacterium]|nr:DUF1028 domain-containing protein [Vicinamibacterales bacterium]